MKGTNEIRLNKAAMIEGMQMYMNSTFCICERVEVTNVEYLPSAAQFNITFQEVKKPIKAE